MWAVRFVRRLIFRVSDDRLSLIAAGIAFYALMAVFPGVAALVALGALFTDANQVVASLTELSEIMPEQAARIVVGQAERVALSSDAGLSLTLLIGVGLSIYLSTRATTGLMHGLNVVAGQREGRGIFRFWFTVLVLTAITFFGAVLLIVLLVGIPALVILLPDMVQNPYLVQGLGWAMTALLLLAALELFYRFGPDHGERHWRVISPGTFVAFVLWVAGSLGFTLYVANFARYNEVFGSLGGVVILLTWLWLSAFVILFGALIDSELRR